MDGINGINDIIAVTKAVAGTTNFGKVDVEFTLEATFTVNDIPNRVKVKCYPTKCQVTITHMGGNCTKKDHLGGNFTPRYFAENFILPWGRRLVDSCKDLYDVISSFLQAELKSVMELNRQPKSSAQAKKSLVFNSPRNESIMKVFILFFAIFFGHLPFSYFF